MTEPLQRVTLSTGVDLDVQVAGARDRPAVILLHGFPESHRTWRDIVPNLAADHFVLAPDQRGYARSSKPDGVEHYAPDRIVADLFGIAPRRSRCPRPTSALRAPPGWTAPFRR